MKPIANYSAVKAAGTGFEVLPAGAYVCRIEMCEEKPNRNNGGSHLEIHFEIAEGDYRGWFEADCKSQQREDPIWRGIIRQSIPNEGSAKYDMQLGFFKRFTDNLEASNEGYHWDWNEAALRGKLIGVVFGEVERKSARGTRYMTTQADSLISVQAVREGKFRIPAPKLLEGSTTGAPTFTAYTGEDDLPI